MQAGKRLARALPLLLLPVLLAGCREGGLSGCGGRFGAGRSAAANPASEAAVATQLRAIQSAQNVFLSRHEHYACMMAELGSQFGLIDRQLAYGHKDGYNYTIECSVNDNPAYQVWATPADSGLMGPSSFCIDQTGQMRRASHHLDYCSQGRFDE